MSFFSTPPKNIRIEEDAYPRLPQPLTDGAAPSFWWRRHGGRFEPSAKLLEEIELEKLGSAFRACLPAALAATPQPLS